MSEEILIRQGAPTLAGIKTGSLFPFPCEDHEALMTDIRRLNRRLTPKGLCLLPLRFLPGQALLYLYRPAGLRRDLRDVQASELLRQAGYGDESCERCVARLICRFREDKEFPHEVGLFLSYPPEDVKGFIDHRASGFKCVVVLPKGTNTDITLEEKHTPEDDLLFARNKWLLSHPDANIAGSVAGIKGENLSVK